MRLERLPAWAYWLVALLPVLAVLAFAVTMRPGAQAVLVAILLYFVWGLAFAGKAWRQLDETSREAQKSAWFWGGSFSLFALLVVCTIAMTWPSLGDPIHEMIEQMSAKASHRGELLTFTLGVLAAGVVQIVATLFMWSGWWLSKRR